LWTTVVVERLPGEPYLLAGLPYAADDGDRVRRTAEGAVASAGTLRLTHPEAQGAEHFDARAELTQEQAAFALAADPRGYGNPDEGWRHLVSSTALEAGPVPGTPDDLHVFAVRYGSAAPLTVAVERDGEALRIGTSAFTAVIGADDERGEPQLTLRPIKP
ncbi:MAG: hypothetical protein HOQ18_13370, partial [Dermatophilaceae bacterium]|nr:hypothetical protein [Dermatophilaceae bacterium]